MRKALHKSGRYLQLALDLVDLEKALEIARIGVEHGVDIVEAGTPLIKSVGMRAVRELRREFKALVLADMKTLDTGALEVRLAADAGADIVSVSALAPIDVIREAVREAKRLKVLIQADLLGAADPLAKISELEGLGVDIFCVHRAIDVERRERIPYGVIGEICRRTSALVSVAGGIGISDVKPLLSEKVNVLVVGRAITQAPDVALSAFSFKREILSCA